MWHGLGVWVTIGSVVARPPFVSPRLTIAHTDSILTDHRHSRIMHCDSDRQKKDPAPGASRWWRWLYRQSLATRALVLVLGHAVNYGRFPFKAKSMGGHETTKARRPCAKSVILATILHPDIYHSPIKTLVTFCPMKHWCTGGSMVYLQIPED